MKLHLPRLRASLFAAATLSFLLPFATVSCPGMNHSFTGMQIALGTSVEEPQMFGPPAHRKVEGEPLAFLAFIVALVGVGVALMAGAPGRAASMFGGAAGAVLLFALKQKLETDAQRQTGGMAEIHYAIGFWLAMIAFLAASAAGAFLGRRSATAGRPDQAPVEG